MSHPEWMRALWLVAVAALIAIAGIVFLGTAVYLGADPPSRPDDSVDWTLYGWLLLGALTVCLFGLHASGRLYRRAFDQHRRGADRHRRDQHD